METDPEGRSCSAVSGQWAKLCTTRQGGGALDPLLLFVSLVILITWNITEILLSLTFKMFKLVVILLSLRIAFRKPTKTKPVYLRFFCCRLDQTWFPFM